MYFNSNNNNNNNNEMNRPTIASSSHVNRHLNNSNNNISTNNRGENLDANDDFDSDQLDEDESLSWTSTDNPEAMNVPSNGNSRNNNNSNNTNNHGLGVNQNGGSGGGECGGTGPSSIANWRDWRSNNFFKSNCSIQSNNTHPFLPFNQPQDSSLENKLSGSKKKSVDTLVNLCAKYIAESIPFESVESYPEPVPEELQLKITFFSFPDNIDNIRLYSCLANGNVDEYLRGELLYQNKSVRKIIQIGFHLSAQVMVINNNNPQPASGLSSFNVGVLCDRTRIVSCTCTCTTKQMPLTWCSHIVAVCLHRILEPYNVEYRTPVSESLSKLNRDQLQKFAQYLISELPQQVLSK
jgi:hypothetical protein